MVWPILASVLTLMLVVPIHLRLWLPVGDRRFSQPDHDGRGGEPLGFNVVGLLFCVLTFHLAWTLSSCSTVPTATGMALLLLGNTLLAPCFFAWAHTLWFYNGLKKLPIDRPWSSEIPRSVVDELPSVSVVVPCRNEPLAVVRLTIESVLKLEYPKRKLSLVVTDNSDDDHGELRGLCQYIHQLTSVGVNVSLLHRRGTEGFKAGNLDHALKEISADLVLFLDVDNSIPADSLISHVGAFDKEGELAFLQFYNVPVSQPLGRVPSATANLLERIKFEEFIRADLGGWPMFQGHNCIWRTSALKQIAPLSRTLCGKSLLVEDMHMTLRANRLGMHGRMVWSPAAFWSPLRLVDLESMLVRWCYGTIQVLLKEFTFLLSRCHGTLPLCEYMDLWDRLIGSRAKALFPFILILLPKWGKGSEALVACWAFIFLIETVISITPARPDDDAPHVPRLHPSKLFDIFLLSQFARWCDLRAMAELLTSRRKRWVPTSKVAASDQSENQQVPTSFGETKRRPFGSLGYPLACHLSLLLLIIMHQILDPMSPSALVAWIPLMVQVLGVLAAIFMCRQANPAGSESLIMACSALRWGRIHGRDLVAP